MAQAVVVAAIAAGKITAGTTAAVLATTAAAVVDLAITSSYQKKKAADAQKDAASAPRDVTVRSAIEPARIIYGKARTSGPVVYTNTQPTPGTNDNSTLWTAISLANHECASIEEVWLDGDQILWSQLSGTGGVTSGKYGPINTNEVTNFYAKLGTPSQTALSQLVSAFSDWTSSYTGQDITYLVSAFELGTATGEGVWAQGAPNNIRAVVKGKKVYDPRKDSTNGGSGVHRLADPTTWEWSDNPALCLADYLFDDRLGMGAEGVTYNDIDWAMVATAADVCDQTVSIPGGSEKRFTCNGVLSTGETYANNIRALVTSMNGMLTWTGGKYRIRACAYEAPVYSFLENDIVGDVQVQPERTRSQRFNTIRGTYIDPESDYNSTEFIPVTNSTYQNTRDNGQKLTTNIALAMTNSEYMAQRLAYKSLNLNNQQLTAVIPVNWRGLKVGVGDRIQVTVSELSWSSKIFVVEGWSFEPDKGFMLTVKEDSSSAYADPGVSDYSTRTLAGTVTFANQPVAAPSGLQATSEEEAILLEWEAPPRGSGYDEVVVYASANSSWANATEVGRTRSTSFRHELTNGTTRYYWVRSVDVDGEFSIRDPDSDTSTVTATAGQISTSQLNDDANFADTANWPDITGPGKPVDNATRNVIYQQASEPTTGLNDGDIWIDTDDGYRMYLRVGGAWVDRSDTRIATALADAATAQSTADGKIVTFYQDGEPSSADEGDLWIDTNDDNKLYRYNGSAWVLARDSGIASAISAATTAQDTADGKVTTFYAASGSPPTAEATGDLWYQTDTAFLFRWNGSSWQEVASYNTGALADKDTVASGDIDEGAVKGKTIALLLNQNSSGGVFNGNGAFVGVNNAGEAAPGTDGFFNWNGIKYTVNRNQLSVYTFVTSVLNKKGYVVYDITNIPFSISGLGSSRTAFVWKEDGQWYYDNDAGTGVAFTPTQTMLAVAFLNKDGTQFISRSGLLAEPVQITAIAEIFADYISAGTIDASVITVKNLDADEISTGILSVNRIPSSVVFTSELSDGTTVISGDNILTGEVSADRIDVTGLITANGIITNSATINNDIKIGSGESVFKADSNGIYLGSETFGSAEFRVTPAGALTATSANITGSITASSLTLQSGVTIPGDKVNTDNVTLTASGGNLIVKGGGVNTTQLALRSATDTFRADMPSNVNYSTSWTTLVSITGQAYNGNDIAEISWGIGAHPEASGAPYIAIRILIYASGALQRTQYFIGEQSVNLNTWAQIQQALFSSSMQYFIGFSNSNWQFYLQAATNANGTFPRQFRAPGTYMQIVRLKR
jgi:hypothetical protein